MKTPRLHLTKKGTLFRYRWFAGPRQASMEFRRDLNEFGLTEMQALLTQVQELSSDGGNSGSSLQELGQALYQLLIPDDLHAMLQRNTHPLAIYGGEPLFPWEILHDGEQFLGVRFPIGRLPSWFEPLDSINSTESSLAEEVTGAIQDQVRVVGLSDMLSDLPEARREVHHLMDTLPTRQVRISLSGDQVSFPAISSGLAENDTDFTLVHIAGRSSFENNDGPLVPLKDGTLTPRSFLASFPGRVWAFFNLSSMPESAKSAASTGVSFASSLLDKGVQAVIVSLQPNFSSGGRQMIGHYYRCLFEGIAPAQALMVARQRFLARNPKDPAWSSFVFFGDPGAMLLQPTPRVGAPERSLEPAGAGPAGTEAALPGAPGKRDGHANVDGSLPTGDSALEYDFDLEQAIGIALMEAKNLHQDFIGTPHLFIGLTKCPGMVTRALLESSGFDPKKVRDTIRYALGFGHAPLDAKILPTQRCARALKAAELNARKDNDQVVREKHLLSAILQSGEGLAFEVLKKMGADPQKLYERLQRGEIPQARSRPGGDTPTIDRYGRDLTLLAEQGVLPALTGRAEELMRLAQILLRRFKNNPLIIGEAGVGKTALVEGLAQRIVAGAVPEELRDRRLVELSLAGLVAGTRYRGDFEERLTQVIREAREHKEVILFLDEFHTVVGAGETHQGTLDAANILKPALARGEIRCIGATTPVEYRRHIEKDAALARRFHPLFLEEPSMDETLEILQGARIGYEEHHKVALPAEVLKTAVDLAVRYLPDRRLPDKAFDLIDEACALVTLRGSTAALLTPEGKIRTLTSCPVVSEPAIYKVLADWTGIPVGEISREESRRLLELEERLGQKVFGQPAAVRAIAHAIQLGRAGLKRPGRPTAVLLFIGPSGVGKTELCRALARELFGDESALIRLDMSEFSEKHSSSKLIGAPPGYVGFGDDGQILSQLHHRPYSVVLLDEVEKSHPEVLDLFLQLFDDGRLTDSLGRTVDGRHAVFIMTSNIFAEHFHTNRKAVGFQVEDTQEVVRADVDNELLRHFRPEFLNRIDESVLFLPLEPDVLLQIARLRFEELAESALQQGVTLSGDEDALRYLVRESVNPALGARPLLRALERAVARPLSRLILNAMSQGQNQHLKIRLTLIDGEPQLIKADDASPPTYNRSERRPLADK